MAAVEVCPCVESQGHEYYTTAHHERVQMCDILYGTLVNNSIAITFKIITLLLDLISIKFLYTALIKIEAPNFFLSLEGRN